MSDGTPGAEAQDLPFRELAQQLPSLCWISDAEGRVIWVNDAWIAYTGMDLAAIQARGLAEIHDPKTYPEVVKLWVEVKAHGEAAETQFPLKARDGQFRQFRTQVVPLRDRNGAVSRWFGTNTDISAQSATEARLRSTQEELAELFDASGAGIFVADAAGRYTAVNPAACRLLGYDRDELLALSVTDLIAPADRQRQTRFAASASREPATGDWRLKRRDGAFVDVEISARILSDGRHLAIVRDISSRVRETARLERRAEQAAARAEAAEQVRSQLWEASRDLLAVFRLNSSRPLMINAHAWTRTLGYTAEELSRIEVMDLVHPDDIAAIHALRQRLEVEGAYFGLENRYRRKDGGLVWLSWNIVRDGEHSFCIGRDITEERARAEHAERAQRLEALGKLTGGVAHDFNNLLTTILGALDLMQRRPDDKALRERLTTAALAAVRRGERLNKQLLSFARREPSRSAACDVPALLADMRPLLSSALPEHIALRYELDPKLSGCSIDAAQLEAALLNLVVNARDAMPEGGIVTVRTRAPLAVELGRYSLSESDFVVLEVLDTGEGMTAEVLAHAFEPFFTTKEVGRGSGLGLAQVYGAARQAGGVATVESEPGAGTAVRLFLRAAAAPDERADVRRAAPNAGERILLVEDDVLVAVVTESLLRDEGYEVIRAGDAVEALAALRGGGVDILITDVRMPGAMNGVELARAATRADPALKVLLCSGWTAESLGRDLADARWPFIAKPFDQAQLKQTLIELRSATAERAD